MVTILYFAGLVCTVWCVLDIWKKNITLPGKIISAVLVFFTSWAGLIAYYFWARNHVEKWFK